MTRAVPASAALALAAALVLSGCDGVAALPLPGGADVGRDPLTVTVEFRDVLDLVPRSSVKVGEVDVGRVDRIELDGWTARVHLTLRRSVRLPDNAVAELRTTSLLGEKFVSLGPPPGTAPVGRLGDGDVIPLERSGRNPEVEEVLSALSLLLNGGGVGQLKTITVELNKALVGRESDVRGVLRQLDTFLGGLDAHKSEIVRMIDSLDRLAGRLASQRTDIATALDGLAPGLEVLADQRSQLTSMLTALSELGVVGGRVIRTSRADTVADLRALEPILTKLREAGDNLPKALEMAFTYPFPRNAPDAMKGDYTNLRLTADLDLRNLAANNPPPTLPPLPGLPSTPPLPGVPGLPGGLPTPTALPTSEPTAGPSVPSLPPVPTVPPVPTLPAAPGMPGAQSAGGGGADLATLLLGWWAP